MAISFSQTTQVTCPQCNHVFPFEVWLIVAADERPDLVAHIRASTVHALICPQCGKAFGGVDAPLIIFQPNTEPPILFSMVQQTTSEQDQEQAIGLINILKDRIGDDWKDEWLARGIAGVQRTMLPVALADDPEAAMQDLREHDPVAFAQLDGDADAENTNEPASTMTPPLAQALNAFVSAPSWTDSYRQVHAHSELLSDNALALLDQVISAAEAQSNADAVAFYSEHRDLLGRCRAIGVDAAFAEKLGVAVEQLRDQSDTASPPPDIQAIIARINQLNRIPDMPQRVKLCHQALTLVSQATHPQLWAALQVELGNSLAQNPLGERAENLEQAIAAYEQALTVRTCKAMPIAWAQTTMNLATAYSDRIRGERAENLEAAIAAHKQALTVMTREAMPVDWATTTNNLATAYYSRIRGERAENLEQAIAAYEQALTVRIREAMPVEWATTTMNLATAYSDRIRGERAENLEQAIAAYQQALTVRTCEAMPVAWAQTTMNLATAYYSRIRGERAENLEQAIAAYQQALTVMTREAMPIDWAQTTMNLATAYSDRIRGERAENLEQAIATYQQALTVRTREAMPIDWAQTTMNLATAYYSRIRGERAENLEQAIAAYEKALTVMTREAMPVDWATTTMNLATAYYSRIRGERAENLEQAIAAYKQALTVRTREAMPVDWAQTTVNLATAYYSRIRGERAENLEAAIAAYEKALEIFQPDALPDNCRRTARSLGNIYADSGQWFEAGRAYSQAIQAAESLYLAAASQFSKEAELNTNGDLYRRSAFALAHHGNLHRAVEVLEQGRARDLGATLDRDRADLVALKQTHSDLAAQYLEAAAMLRQIEISERSGPSPLTTSQVQTDATAAFLALTAQAHSARIKLDAAITTIRQVPGYTDFLALPGWDDITRTVRPGVPLVYQAATPQGSLVLIVSSQAEVPTVLLLEGFTEANLNTLLITRKGDAVDGGYLPGQLGDHIMLSAALDTALPLLGEHLIAPLAAELRAMGAHGVTLIPTGLLSLLPLHAATYAVGGETCCLLDEFDVAYAPSARVLATAQREAQQRQGAMRLAGVGNPTRDLRYAGRELAAICDLLPAGVATPFYEAQARRDALWEALPEATIAHLSCHGRFANDPLDSALYLAGDDRITLRELVTGDMSALANLRLVVMSACQTAINDFRRVPDESIGLPGGFLQAGVPAVVGTLWSVDDLSTALLMHRFYELYLQGDSAAGIGPQPSVRALRLAQCWLRDLSYQAMYDYFEQYAELAQAGLDAASSTRMPGNLIDEGMLRAEQGAIKTPTARPYTHPFAWAAFTFSGAIESQA